MCKCSVQKLQGHSVHSSVDGRVSCQHRADIFALCEAVQLRNLTTGTFTLHPLKILQVILSKA